jgi:hypothetical protein
MHAVRYLYRRGALIAALPMSRSARRRERRRLRTTADDLKGHVDGLCAPGGRVDERIAFLRALAVDLLVEPEPVEVDVLASGTSRVWPAVQLIGALVAVGAVAVGVSLLIPVLGASVSTVVTGLFAGIVSTVVAPALKHLANGRDLDWLATKLFPGRGDKGDDQPTRPGDDEPGHVADPEAEEPRDSPA